ncbi:hypothetical protein [Eubacterium sp. 1001713B170207_170306_E7]|nr:hypothetical protein [Eubacterium sp. 1001713B170207_170306_E7]
MDVGREKGIGPEKVEEPPEEQDRQEKHICFSTSLFISGGSLY